MLTFCKFWYRFGSESLFWRWSFHWLLEIPSILATTRVHKIHNVNQEPKNLVFFTLCKILLMFWRIPIYRYPHCLYFLELLQNASFRNAMAHPANKELTHRQQFYFWKNYRNNRLKHILPRPLPETTAPPPSNAVPPPPTTTIAAASSGGPVAVPPVLSPMQYGVPSGPPLKSDPRSGIDRRKRK